MTEGTSFFSPLKSATEIAKQIKVSSVLNSLVWMMPLLVLALIVVSFTDNKELLHFLMWLTGANMGTILLCFVGILCFGDPNLLRSENHVFKLKALEHLGDQTYTVEDIGKLVEETNPELPDPSTIEIPPPKNTEEEYE